MTTRRQPAPVADLVDDPVADLVDDLIDRFRGRKPIRTGALVITLFGDIVAVRGGSLWLGSLLEIMAGFGLGGGLVRTAVTRLVADGWLERRRLGRQSYYRFSEAGQARATQAAARIYAAAAADWSGTWRVVLMPGGPSEARERLRKDLGWRGFAGLGPAVMVAVGDGGERFERDLDRLVDGSGAVLVRGKGRGDAAALRAVAHHGWDLAPLEEGYRAFIDGFGPLRDALTGGAQLDGFRALALRLLLVHEYRRVLLRDPDLPPEMLPADWPGAEALALCRAVYRCVSAESEAWISVHCTTEAGPLPPPDAAFLERFGESRGQPSADSRSSPSSAT